MHFECNSTAVVVGSGFAAPISVVVAFKVLSGSVVIVGFKFISFDVN